MNLPKAPEKYEQMDQDQLRNALELAVGKLEAVPGGWQAATGTATRTTFATTTVTLQQLAEAVKALIDDLILHNV